MRKSNLFRTLAAVAMLAVVTMSANAQLTTTGTATALKNGSGNPSTGAEAVDFATVGSTMPYSITPDPVIAAQVTAAPLDFLASVFSWRVTAGGTFNGLGAAVGAYVPTCYAPSAVTVSWTTTGVKTITVAEQSRNNIGLTECVGADSTLTIYVMAKPTVVFNEAASSVPGTITNDQKIGGCGVAGTTVNFAVDLTGTDLFQVTYTYDYTPFGVVIPVTTGPTTTANLGTSSFLTINNAIANSETVNNAFSIAVPASGAGAYGKYVVTINGVTDRTSRKSLNTPAQDTGDLTGTPIVMTLYSTPQPVTGTIKHVTNAGW